LKITRAILTASFRLATLDLDGFLPSDYLLVLGRIAYDVPQFRGCATVIRSRKSTWWNTDFAYPQLG
jgi:hypothetical protein